MIRTSQTHPIRVDAVPVRTTCAAPRQRRRWTA